MGKEDNKKKYSGFSNNIIGNNFKNNVINIGDGNNQSASTSKSNGKKSIITKIIIDVLIAVVSGLIVWYLIS
ncbi:MAG: hypothetical protein COZ80_10440 [Ignavibacteria bacterium CG_4_8_14_3_um_filter_37_9]|nr:hypothetical protein [Ignavibacteria bacterium]OIO18181.1 MAG: hypothetical protein AUJ54_08715 [Ignavibacteria bacterium CG1_02_37_35]PIW98471.1 MAG: hypothetical protein COZ80_10440 [Ignavibacteria bacterium CG_4_8_14_3_um_filter_37_9]PIX93129.1 MAG: hypothetical protein COZ25_12300 [Ignavibacteria bacterium CG_4_10_14_3_um_filter_37_18]PJC59465.1 MAG: hypothetical protein CO025_06025 [Ignavibacteria bacterium CG_4_9_14_0_2_um_filter_37_13]